MKTWKNAFTLIEMLIVICIISIILWFTMSFSWDRIQLLNNKNIEEQFITTYNDYFYSVMNSNYISWSIYDELLLSFSSWGNYIEYNFQKDWNSVYSWTNSLSDKIKIVWLKLWSTQKNKTFIKYTPYQLWCQFFDSSDWEQINKNLHIKISVNNDREEKCFQIKNTLWRLIEFDCRNWNNFVEMDNLEDEEVKTFDS